MNEDVTRFLRHTGPVLCVDIGACNQDAILARPGQNCESWPRFSIPSRSMMVAQRIRTLTLLKRGIWLYGEEMGGSFTIALAEHLKANLPAACTSIAAKSMTHELSNLLKQNLEISEICPRNAVPIYLGDYDPEFWDVTLRHSGLPQPHLALACARDHGIGACSNSSDRMVRLQKRILDQPAPETWIYEDAPEYFSRLRTIQSKTGGPVAEATTGIILGALCDPRVIDRSYTEGVIILYAGCLHMIIALVYAGEIQAVLERNTKNEDPHALEIEINKFKSGEMLNDKDYSEHGIVYSNSFKSSMIYNTLFISGPRYRFFKELGTVIAPYGDMVHASCFGLLYGWAKTQMD